MAPSKSHRMRARLAWAFPGASARPARRLTSAPPSSISPRTSPSKSDQGQAMKGASFPAFSRAGICISATIWCYLQLGGAAGRVRGDLLHRRPARDHRAAGPGAIAGQDPRGRGGLPRRRARCTAQHDLRPEPRAGPHPARLGVQLRDAARLAQPHDPVQGQGRQAARPGADRPLRLSGADGRRHPRLPGDPRAGRRGPEAASGAVARHRGRLQPTLRDRFFPTPRALDLRRRDPGHEPARRPEEDEQLGPERSVPRSTSPTMPTRSRSRSGAPSRTARWG